MLNYEKFKELLMRKLLIYLPVEMQDSILELREQRKVNQTVEALSVKLRDGSYLPYIEVNALYQRYLACRNIEKVLSEAAASLLQHVYSLYENSMLESYERGIDGIFMMLVNQKDNEELLKTVPHRIVGGNALIYRYAVGKTDSSIESFIITNQYAKEYEMSEDELFGFASINTPKLFAPRIRTAEELIVDFCEEYGLSPGMTEDIVMAVTRGMRQRWSLTNEPCVYGAVYLFYTDVLDILARRAEDDLYLLPVSVNDVFVAPVGQYSMEQIRNNIGSVFGNVRPQDRLSRQLYHYTGKERQLSIVGKNGLSKSEIQISGLPDIIIRKCS